MTKQEIINKFADELKLSKYAVEKVITGTFHAITDDLIAGNQVAIPGFGKFIVRDVPERNGRNPRTGEAIVIPAHKAVVFKPATALKNAVNKE